MKNIFTKIEKQKQIGNLFSNGNIYLIRQGLSNGKSSSKITVVVIIK